MTVLVDARRYRIPEGASISTADAAELLRLPYRTLHWWVKDWYPGTGSGYRIRLTRTDFMVCRAFYVINRTDVGRRSNSRNPLCIRMRELAETAIRAEPRQWLLVSVDEASTHDDRDIAPAVAALKRCRHWVIDLWSLP